MYKVLIAFILIILNTNTYAQHVELGKVDWLRSYDEAIDLSKTSNKPILILFQEVPGCATCRNYGNNVLSHPLMVDVIQHYFVPLAIFNNKGGPDKKILELYKEPTWNNPVVRIVDQKGENLVKRLAGQYDAYSLTGYMIDALNAIGQKTPQNLLLLSDILLSKADSEISFAMYCFWTGEKELGKIDGIVSTEAGFQNGREVVVVNFDSSQISENELKKKAQKVNCADRVYDDSEGFRKDKDPKFYLKKTEYRYLPLHPLQAARMNSLVGEGMKDLDHWLFPSQINYLEKIRNGEIKDPAPLYDEPFDMTWKKMFSSE